MEKQRTRRRRWTQEEIDYLEHNYGVMSTKDIAKKLDRSEAAVSTAATTRNMALKGQLEYAVYHDDEYQISGNQEECAEFLGMSVYQFHLTKAPSYAKKAEIGIRIVSLGMWRINENEDVEVLND